MANNHEGRTSSRLWAVVALCLFVPAPSIGVMVALHAEMGQLGTLLWGLAKLWLFIGPELWWLCVQRLPWSWSPPQLGGFGVAVVLGLVMVLVIWGGFWFWGLQYIDLGQLRHKMQVVGLTDPWRYGWVCLYWIAVNSLLEEYVFRFFLYRQCETIVGHGNWVAVLLAALFFTVHHTLALAAYVPWQQNVLASLGVFTAGAIWSALYARYRSIWPGFVCHALADVGVFSVGAYLLFGAAGQ